jgi:hypothetical protein
LAWTVILVDEVDDWFLALAKDDPASADAVEAAIDLLEREGSTLGRPVVDRIEGARVHNMKELRPKGTSILIPFALADARYDAWLAGRYGEEF